MQLEHLRVERYAGSKQRGWDMLVRASKNGTFLIERSFMEYHRDRFEDASVVALLGEQVVAVLPAARQRRADGDWLASHPGLTYGGWIVDERMTAAGMLRLFDLVREHAMRAGFVGLNYKPVPRVYHRLPADEDLYALFVKDAVLVQQDLSSVIDLQSKADWSKGKRQALAKARSAGLLIAESQAFDVFVALLADVLSPHRAKPVHTAAELVHLKAIFPDQIRLFAAMRGAEAIAFVLVFDCGRTVHTQYMANGAEGRKVGALEAIVDHLQHEAYSDRRYLSFGISTEDAGRILNRGLVAQKEMFGARGLVCQAYDLRFTD